MGATKEEIEYIKRLMARALDLVNSVPYRVSLRWLFYRLLQEGWYGEKRVGYKKFTRACSKFRKQFRDGWHPYTLIDSTRGHIINAYGAKTFKQCLDDLPNHIADNLDFHIDHFYKQNNYVEIWFEARAMIDQFRHYTNDIDLVPFGGDSSIPQKWEIATRLEQNSLAYGKPIVVLYFGDYDDKGEEICRSALKDIRRWCDVEFDLIWCGLTKEQAEKYEIPENPEKPGQYQWEALDDEAAAEIIKVAVATWLDLGVIEKVNKSTLKREKKWRELIAEAIAKTLQENR